MLFLAVTDTVKTPLNNLHVSSITHTCTMYTYVQVFSKVIQVYQWLLLRVLLYRANPLHNVHIQYNLTYPDKLETRKKKHYHVCAEGVANDLLQVCGYGLSIEL